MDTCSAGSTFRSAWLYKAWGYTMLGTLRLKHHMAYTITLAVDREGEFLILRTLQAPSC